MNIPFDSQRKLIELSRRTLDNFVRGRDGLVEIIEDPSLLSADYGAFVTLRRKEELRGCLGTCFPTRPLCETVMEMTQGAASKDYRFSPVTQDELSAIHIDISVISPMELTSEPLSLEVGRHGLYVACEGQRGVLLPQVAAEHGWDMKTFLSQTCCKAELAQDAWKRPETRVSSFTALIIEEGE